MTPPEHSLPRRLSRKCRTLREHIRGVSHRTILLVVLVVALGALIVTAGPALSQSGESPTPATEANNSTVAPGAQVASAVSVEGTLLSGNIQQRTLNIELTRATSDEERAAIVATTISTLDRRLDGLEERAQRLRNARQADRMRAVTFRSEYAAVAAEARTLDRTLGQLRTAATELPASQFEAQSTNTSSIARLDERTSALTDGENVTLPTLEPTSIAPATSTAPPGAENATTGEGSPTTDQPAGSTEANGTDSSRTDDADDGDDDADDGDDDADDGDDDADDGDGDTDDGDDDDDDTSDTDAAENGG